MSTGRRVSIAVQTDKKPAEYAALAQLAESYGFDTVSAYADLLYQPPLPALLTMAQHTSRVRLGAACLNPWLTHPVEIAGQVAALDTASRGRAYLGLARGSWLDAVGVGQHRPVRALREAIDVVRHLLRRDPRPYDGEVFSLAPGTTLRYETYRSAMPVLVGGWGEQTLRVAGEVADEVKVGGSANPRLVPLVRERILAGTRAVGRPDDAVALVLGAVSVVDEDGVVARRLARTEVAMYLAQVAALDPTAQVPPDLLDRVRSLDAAGRHEDAGRLIPDDVLDAFAFAGTPEQVAAQADALFAAGVDRVEFGTPHGLTGAGGVELLGKRVLPLLRR